MLNRLIILAASFMLPLSVLLADGAKVSVFLKSGEVLEGELIAVRNDAILIARQPGLSEKALAQDSTSVMRLPLGEVGLVRVPGSSHVLLGALIGLPVGIAAGALIGASMTDEPKNVPGLIVYPLDAAAHTAAGAAIGGAGGLVLGLIVGGAASQSDQDFPPTDIAKLRTFARYSGNEPGLLQRTQ